MNAPFTTYPYFTAPDGYTLLSQDDGTYTIEKGDQAVGGIALYPLPENYDPTDTFYRWIENSGISAFGDPALTCSGSISYLSNGWCSNFSRSGSNQPANIVQTHIFFVNQGIVHDFWGDNTKLTDEEWNDLHTSLSIPE